MASHLETPAPNKGRVTQIFKYNDGTFIENLSILPDGRLLLAPLDRPYLLVLDPESAEPIPATVITLPGVNSLAALARIDENVYAVSGGNHTSFAFQAGSMKVFVVSLSIPPKRSEPISGVVTNVIPVVDTAMMNGMANGDDMPHVIFSHDSIQGRLLRVDTKTSEVSVESQHDLFGRGGNEQVPLGANGIKCRVGHLYFTNSAQGKFCRVGLKAGHVTGEVETIAELDGPITMNNAYDDFAFDSDGNAYVALHPSTVNKITPQGEQVTFAGGVNTTDFQHPTAAVLANDGKAIFVSTGGNFSSASTGGGGQIVKVELE